MWRNVHDTYLEERILSADPVELVHLLYQGAITAVGDGRRHLAEKQILARARCLSKACDILIELNTSLDFERGGELSVRLSQLYGYMHRRLLEGNTRQTDEPLAEVLSLLVTLSEGWASVKAALTQEAPRQSPWMDAAMAIPEVTHVASNWSF
jgi:flagellar protein FliS